MEKTLETFDLHYELMYRQVLDEVLELFPEFRRISAIFMLDDMEETHGESSIIAMSGFLNYARTHSLDTRDIKSTLAHDFNGRKDKYMLPRTSEYVRFANQKNSSRV